MSNVEKYCTECGKANNVENEFCMECGHSFLDEKDTQDKEDSIIEEETDSKEGVIDLKEESVEEKPETEVIIDESSNEKKTVENKDETFFVQAKDYILHNKIMIAIIAAIILVAGGSYLFFAGSIKAHGTWTTSDDDLYKYREDVTVDISRKGKVKVSYESTDYLNGNFNLDFTIKRDEWAKNDSKFHTSYTLDEIGQLELTVPNLTYQHERSDIIDEFKKIGATYEIKEGKKDVTIIFDFSDVDEFNRDDEYETIIKLIDADDKDNEFQEDYITLDFLFNYNQLFSK